MKWLVLLCLVTFALGLVLGFQGGRTWELSTNAQLIAKNDGGEN